MADDIMLNKNVSYRLLGCLKTPLKAANVDSTVIQLIKQSMEQQSPLQAKQIGMTAKHLF